MRVISIIITAFLVFIAGPTYAQSQSTFKRTTATVLFASIGGGVLGLSTLSFYGKPQEHTDNITTGVLVGFIAGVTYVAYDNYSQQQADQSKFEEWQRLSQSTRTLAPAVSWPVFSFTHTW